MGLQSHRLKSVDALVSQVETQCHPGLMLDKLLRGVPEKSEDVKQVAPSVVDARGDDAYLKRLRARHGRVLAGAGQSREDCDLRGATLRGQLRWWWRTLHAGHLRPDALRQLEEAIWGSSSKGGAVSVRVEAAAENKDRVKLAPFKKLIAGKNGMQQVMDNAFCARHGIVLGADNKTTPGLSYLAYGMDEYSTRTQTRKQRACMEAPAYWLLSIECRDTIVDGTSIPAEMVRRQALAALGLLVQRGAVGSRSRKGFGSLQAHDKSGELAALKAPECAAELRKAIGHDGLRLACADTPWIEEMKAFEAPIRAGTAWQAMHIVGCVLRDYASSLKHDAEKLRLGLPRQIHGPRPQALQHQVNHTPPLKLGGLKAPAKGEGRHPAPLFFSLKPHNKGFLVRVTFFPDALLQHEGKQPDLQASKQFVLRTLVALQKGFLAHKP